MPITIAITSPISTDDTDSTRCCQTASAISGMCLGAQFKCEFLLGYNKTSGEDSRELRRIFRSSSHSSKEQKSDALSLEEFGGNVSRLFLVAIDLGVQAAHVLIVEKRADLVQNLGDL